MLLTWLRLVFVRRSVYVFDTFLYGTNVPVNVIFDLDFDFDIVQFHLELMAFHVPTYLPLGREEQTRDSVIAATR